MSAFLRPCCQSQQHIFQMRSGKQDGNQGIGTCYSEKENVELLDEGERERYFLFSVRPQPIKTGEAFQTKIQ